MNVRLTSLAGTPLLEIDGDIDHSTCKAVETALDEMLRGNCPVALIDLSEVAYLDSGGISVLLSGARQLRKSGWLGVIGPNDDVRRLLELVGLFVDPSFRAFDDRLAAEAALAQEDRAS